MTGPRHSPTQCPLPSLPAHPAVRRGALLSRGCLSRSAWATVTLVQGRPGRGPIHCPGTTVSRSRHTYYAPPVGPGWAFLEELGAESTGAEETFALWWRFPAGLSAQPGSPPLAPGAVSGRRSPNEAQAGPWTGEVWALGPPGLA